MGVDLQKIIIMIVVLLLFVVLSLIIQRYREGLFNRIDLGIVAVFVIVGLMVGALILTITSVGARGLDGRYAASPLKGWFDSLKSGKGPCCSDADGSAVSDVDWESKDGHYRVRIEDQWWDVPDDAVITEPNRAGRTMVWPIPYRDGNVLRKMEIRCFMPGSMT